MALTGASSNFTAHVRRLIRALPHLSGHHPHEPPRQRQVQRRLTTEQLDDAIRAYGKGWSCQRLAERYGCDDETVRQTLTRAGVRLRRPWERL